MKSKVLFLIAIIISSFANKVCAQYYDPYLMMMHNQFMNYAQQSWQNYQNQQYQNMQMMEQRKRQIQEQIVQEGLRNWNNQNVNSYNNTTTINTTQSNTLDNSSQRRQEFNERRQEYNDRYGYKDCHICHNLKYCQTCGGKGWIHHSMTNTTGDCPNCTNGKCSTCGGSGKVYVLKY